MLNRARSVRISPLPVGGMPPCLGNIEGPVHHHIRLPGQTVVATEVFWRIGFDFASIPAPSEWASSVKQKVLVSSRLGKHSGRTKVALPATQALNPVTCLRPVVAKPRSSEDVVIAPPVVHAPEPCRLPVGAASVVPAAMPPMVVSAPA